MNENELISERIEEFIKDIQETDTKYHNQIVKLTNELDRKIAKKWFIKKPSYSDAVIYNYRINNLEKDMMTVKTNLIVRLIEDIKSILDDKK